MSTSSRDYYLPPRASRFLYSDPDIRAEFGFPEIPDIVPLNLAEIRKERSQIPGHPLHPDYKPKNEKDVFPYGKLDLKVELPLKYEVPERFKNLLPLSKVIEKHGSFKSKPGDSRLQDLFAEASASAAAAATSQSNGIGGAGAASSAYFDYDQPGSSSGARQWTKEYIRGIIQNDDITEAVVSSAQSGRSNDQIQEELFDLLGFDNMDLISGILSNRAHIIADASRTELVSGAVRNQVKRNTADSIIGVTVMSAEEKALEKLYRKEERKAAKTGGGGIGYPQRLQQAEVAVAETMHSKINAGRSYLQQLRSHYMGGSSDGQLWPNVYDINEKARMTAGFISGVKMALPDSAKKSNHQEYEEIDIPAAKQHPPPEAVARPLIEISSLDETAQQVFKGMKALNRIQSLVYETAYTTNENLLICAPTGAGKTNIALLTVLNCIMNHMDGGVIRKDQFKIVYVAPMKALAAEMTASFGKRLACLGIQVRELTGDMQLTKAEIMTTQMLVTTPEKWDVVTRKSTGDVALSQLVKLLIIDEVHLLHGDRGPVIESLVARTVRQVESTQRMIRIVGLSATLPNYKDVATFLRVNPKGLFYFDSRFRPVPLGQTFIGVKALSIAEQRKQMDNVCYEKVFKMVSRGHQVMVFVHARNATLTTAQNLIDAARMKGQLDTFKYQKEGTKDGDFGKAVKALGASRNKKLLDLFENGFAIHHAGLLRSDRNMVEKYFGDGYCKVLVCTATLAWGVNLPAHAVVIKGTEIYDAQHGTFVDLGILDVFQIFGRAGRPQFDTEGHGTIITTHDKLSHYLGMLTNQYPIESSFIKFLADNLNAEISLGTVATVHDAMEWLTYTYLYVRMRKNPIVYGMQHQEVGSDPTLEVRRRELIVECARSLEKAEMIRYDERTEYLHSTDMGRTASHFYIKYDTMEIFNATLTTVMNLDAILAMVSNASEFLQIKVRDDELDELDDLTREYCCLKVWGGSENVHGKVNILIQTYISRGFVKSFSLMSDQNYIVQNAIRICRGYFEIVLRKHNPLLAGRFLEFCKMLDQQLWDFAHPLKQHKFIPMEVLEKIERKKISVDMLRDMTAEDVGSWISHAKLGATVKRCAEELPSLDVEVNVQPITRTVLRIKLTITPTFRWNDRFHGANGECFWIWVEEPINNNMYHNEYFILSKKHVMRRQAQDLIFTIPVQEPHPPQYLVRITSDRFLCSAQTFPVTFQNLILPEEYPPHTDLLDLDPLPITALKDARFERIFASKFTHFNPIQTQIFHCLYHSDTNCLVGAPTGSGKTIAAELAMFRVFKVYPSTKVVYIAPMKALVRERMLDWKIKLERELGKKVVELTGDVTPDIRAITESDVIVTTPEKWDGISRSWQTRSYVQAVSLIIIDEIHLLGEDRGPVLEVIVSRTNFISQHTQRSLRVLGLSTALANAKDLADWLGIKGVFGLFNFRPSVRPVPVKVHIQGFPGKHYCPRMATMNKPTFQAIREHSPSKPALVFVSSRRQTRLTALDLIAYLAGEGNPKQWLHMPEEEMEAVLMRIKEPNLKLTLAFGIGIHHAGLQEQDRQIVEELFVNQKIQILIATATLAWGVNFPAHLVVVKGTEFYDGKLHRYVDMPITDVLQMIGRAGRPQFDDNAVAVVLVHDQKKHFYKKFLYEPFPVESSLLNVLPDHLNAEVVAGTISSTQDAMEYLTYTFFFRRLMQNPSYYGLNSEDKQDWNVFLSSLVSNAFNVLESASCIYIHEDLRNIEPTPFGRIAAYYYLSHETMKIFRDRLNPVISLEDLLLLLTDVHEYAELPVRHNEDVLNEELAKSCPLGAIAGTYNSPHTKAHLLFQCHFSRKALPSSDYYTDTKSVLDQALRLLQALIDACAENGWLAPTLSCINIIQMVVQARWLDDNPLTSLPYLDEDTAVEIMKKLHVTTIPELQSKTKNDSRSLEAVLLPYLSSQNVASLYRIIHEIPAVAVDVQLKIAGSCVDVPYATAAGKQYVNVPSGKEAVVCFHFQRLNSCPKDLRAHTPKFGKPKDEAWFVILGDTETGEVVALKRFSGLKRKTVQQLALTIPERSGRWICSLYVMSDSYLGIDQQYDLCFNIVPSDGKKAPPGFDTLYANDQSDLVERIRSGCSLEEKL